MAKFSRAFQDYFSSDIRYRGEVYFRMSAVRKLKRTENFWACEVQGGTRYKLEFSELEEGREYTLFCSCPFHARGDFCKHGWAMLCALDLTRAPPPEPAVVLHHAEEGAVELPPSRLSAPARSKKPKPRKKAVEASAWRKQLSALSPPEPSASVHPAGRPRLAYYALESSIFDPNQPFRLSFCFAERLKNGAFGVVKRGEVGKHHLPLYEDAQDQLILRRLLEFGREEQISSYFREYRSPLPLYVDCRLPAAVAEELMETMARTGRLIVAQGYDLKNLASVGYADGPPWRALLELEQGGENLRPVAKLRRAGDALPLGKPRSLAPRLLLIGQTIYPLVDSIDEEWLKRLPATFAAVPNGEVDEWIASFGTSPGALPIENLVNLGWQEEFGRPEPLARCSPQLERGGSQIAFEVFFRYGEKTVGHEAGRVADPARRSFLARDPEAERFLLSQSGGKAGTLAAAQFLPWSERLLAEGWRVEVDRQPLRAASEFKIELKGGADWLDLRGQGSFAGGQNLPLPELLRALRERSPFVRLSDGSYGLIPEEWLRRLGLLADWSGGEARADSLRLPKSRAPLIAALLAEEPAASGDETFRTMLEAARSGALPRPRPAAPGFGATLRAYQEEGLGWLDHLAAVGYGGILADDMGLGKTVQVLARLHRAYREGAREPTIIVVPKSLLFNWQAEARRFAPELRVWVHAGGARKAPAEEIFGHQVILVTYAALRLDIELFARHRYLYVIADEAQAIKNPSAQAHQSCLLLKGRHRLAMTGTPVENSGSDLLALLDFVNPGLLGGTARQKLSGIRSEGPGIASLAKVLRPFILRRTKTAVLKDLPEKTEHMDFCELSPAERKRYAELASYYRTKVKRAIDGGEFGRSKILVLEALLRLRQAACHPGLLDPTKANAESAKLSLLLQRLRVLVEEGHRALVFSQFTKLLDIVGAALAREGVSFERLDGQVALEKRQTAVERFQTGGEAKVFLISLKAGGVGLNLTAANYVFLLDPWWNPAAEAQAIDRSHRIGQKQPVLAYRIIAKDTVEEKILTLQAEKRGLADALLDGKVSALKGLTPEDVLALMS